MLVFHRDIVGKVGVFWFAQKHFFSFVQNGTPLIMLRPNYKEFASFLSCGGCISFAAEKLIKHKCFLDESVSNNF